VPSANAAAFIESFMTRQMSAKLKSAAIAVTKSLYEALFSQLIGD